jgi:hypothetical protein
MRVRPRLSITHFFGFWMFVLLCCQNAGDGVVAPPSGRGVLHGALLKDVMAASKNSAGSTMEFVFRIGSAGVQPNPL